MAQVALIDINAGGGAPRGEAQALTQITDHLCGMNASDSIYVRAMFSFMPYEPLVLGLKGRVRLSHLTARDVVVVVCPACHRNWRVAPHVLYDRYHEYQPIDVIAKDFKCRRCNHGDRMYWHLERATGPEFPRAA